MLAFGLEEVAARATCDGEGRALVAPGWRSDQLSQLSARTALANDVSADATLLEVVREDTASNRHPRAHVCAASLRGGIWFSPSQHPPRAVRLAMPRPLFAVLLAPAVSFDPRVVTNALPRQIHAHKHARQSAIAAGLVRALELGDHSLVSALFDDAVIGQAVGPHIPGYHPIVEGARRAGALMAGLSGRGPALGAICSDLDVAEKARDAMAAAALAHSTEFETLISAVSGDPL